MEAGAAAGVLSGIRIVDLARMLGGPSCTLMRGDCGAEVINGEPPQGDEARKWSPPFLRNGTSACLNGAATFEVLRQLDYDENEIKALLQFGIALTERTGA